MHQLVRRAIAEGLDVTKHQAYFRPRSQRLLHGQVVPVRYTVVVIKEVYEVALRMGPADVPYDAWHAACWLWIAKVLHAAPRAFNDLTSGSLGTVVDNDHLNRRAFLTRQAVQRLRQLLRSPKRRHHDGEVDRQEHSLRTDRRARQLENGHQSGCRPLGSRAQSWYRGCRGLNELQFQNSNMANIQTIFNEEWWLSAASGGRHEEVVVAKGNEIVGRLAFIIDRPAGFRRLGMPAFTHLLGPVVTPGNGKPQTELTRRLSIVRSLIDQLPSFDTFRLTLDPSAAHGLASADGLAFQERGFVLRPQYNFRIDAAVNIEKIWEGMDFRTRQHIRRSEQNCSVETLEEPLEFSQFYASNLATSYRRARFGWEQFSNLFVQCRTRGRGEVLVARLTDGSPVAMTFLIWDEEKMYYLLSTRSPYSKDGGAASLLIWHAIKKCHELGISFDFDGVTTGGIARFLCGIWRSDLQQADRYQRQVGLCCSEILSEACSAWGP